MFVKGERERERERERETEELEVIVSDTLGLEGREGPEGESPPGLDPRHASRESRRRQDPAAPPDLTSMLRGAFLSSSGARRSPN